MPGDAEEVRRWLEKAERDQTVAAASLALNPPVTDVAAFHCQQAVEKLLKGFLLSRGIAFERTHDLVELLALCSSKVPSFDSLQEAVAPLTPYAVRFRYPGPADPTLAEVQAALSVVDRVKTLVHSLL